MRKKKKKIVNEVAVKWDNLLVVPPSMMSTRTTSADLTKNFHRSMTAHVRKKKTKMILQNHLQIYWKMIVAGVPKNILIHFEIMTHYAKTTNTTKNIHLKNHLQKSLKITVAVATRNIRIHFAITTPCVKTWDAMENI